MNRRFGHVASTKLGIRHATLRHFCKAFSINLLDLTDERKIDKNSHLSENFIFFLMENKIFIRIYELDYYSDKTIEIIANKIGKKAQVIDLFIRSRKIYYDKSYPFRYISSYWIDKEISNNYGFLNYEDSHIYQGNYECRR